MSAQREPFSPVLSGMWESGIWLAGAGGDDTPVSSFRGSKINVIAKEENVDERYVARLVDQTFEIH